MTCKEAESLVMPYIRHEIDIQEMEDFLEHIDGCENCREELEIYYMVEEGIRQLDSDTDTDRYNIKGDMEADIITSRQQIYRVHLLSALRYAADTLIAMSLVVMFLLQMRIWAEAQIHCQHVIYIVIEVENFMCSQGYEEWCLRAKCLRNVPKTLLWPGVQCQGSICSPPFYKVGRGGLHTRTQLSFLFK